MKRFLAFILVILLASLSWAANTPTTNYGLPKPAKSDSGDDWIADFNSKQDAADAAIKAALDGKAPAGTPVNPTPAEMGKVHDDTIGSFQAQIDILVNDLGDGSLFAPKESPIFTGIVTATDGINAPHFMEMAPAAPVISLVTTGTGNCTNGTHSVRIVFVTADGETDMSAKSNVVTVDASHKQITVPLPLGTSGIVTQRKVYMTIAGDGGFHLLAATVDNNVDETVDINIADGSLGAQPPFNNTTGSIYLGTYKAIMYQGSASGNRGIKVPALCVGTSVLSPQDGWIDAAGGYKVGGGAVLTSSAVLGGATAPTYGSSSATRHTFPSGGITVAASNGPAGTFTCANNKDTVVSNTRVTANSIVILQATNAAAGTLQGAATHLYVPPASYVVGTSFTVTTSNAAAAAGTETFNYWIVN